MKIIKMVVKSQSQNSCEVYYLFRRSIVLVDANFSQTHPSPVLLSLLNIRRTIIRTG